MELDLVDIPGSDKTMREKRRSRHSVTARLTPSRAQYDYLILNALQKSIRELIEHCPAGQAGALALDLGASKSPYKSLLEAQGYVVRTLDIDSDNGADFVGTVEDSRLPSESFGLILCTQVLEHCVNPWRGIQEIARLLKRQGRLLLSVPHVWFYHPHPSDNWRFTQEGIAQVCQMGGLKPERLLSQGGSVLAFGQIVNFLGYGLAGRLGTPFYLLTNSLAGPLDRYFANSTFCLNFACLAVKP